MEGWVYLLDENGDDAVFKIGVTRSDDINKRLKKLQTGNANEIRLRYKFKSQRPFKLESMLHNYYKKDRVNGEWFLLSPEQVDGFADKCKQFEDIIDILKDNIFFNPSAVQQFSLE